MALVERGRQASPVRYQTCEMAELGTDRRPEQREAVVQRWHWKSGWQNWSVVTRQAVPQRSNPHRDRYTIKTLRKILPHLIRPKYGKEVADLVNARHVDDDGRIAGSDTDRYADRLYDNVAEAIREMEPHFRPFLDALGE